MKLAISKISLDGSTQARAGLDDATIESYAESMTAGDTFPPVIVFHDGANHWLADGFHRIAAAKSLGHDKIEADVKAGSREDAVWYAVGANKSNGLRRTTEDKRRAVELALATRPGETDRAIALHVGVTHPTVTKHRNCSVGKIYQHEKRIGIDGRSYNATKPKRETTKEIIDTDTGEVLDNAEVVTTTRERVEFDPHCDIDFGIKRIIAPDRKEAKQRDDSVDITLVAGDPKMSAEIMALKFSKKFMAALANEMLLIANTKETLE